MQRVQVHYFDEEENPKYEWDAVREGERELTAEYVEEHYEHVMTVEDVFSKSEVWYALQREGGMYNPELDARDLRDMSEGDIIVTERGTIHVAEKSGFNQCDELRNAFQ